MYPQGRTSWLYAQNQQYFFKPCFILIRLNLIAEQLSSSVFVFTPDMQNIACEERKSAEAEGDWRQRQDRDNNV